MLEIDKKIDSKFLKNLFAENNILIPFLEDFYYEKTFSIDKTVLVINYSGIKKSDILAPVMPAEMVLLTKIRRMPGWRKWTVTV